MSRRAESSRAHPQTGKPLAELLPTASAEALALLQQILRFDPAKRLTAVEALKATIVEKVGDLLTKLADYPLEYVHCCVCLFFCHVRLLQVCCVVAAPDRVRHLP